jgi:hypothetical protein
LPVVKSTKSLAFDHTTERCIGVDSLERDIADANLYRAHKGKAALDPTYRVVGGAAFIALPAMDVITPAANAWRRMPAPDRAKAKSAAKPAAAPAKSTQAAKPGRIATVARKIVAAVTPRPKAKPADMDFSHLQPLRNPAAELAADIAAAAAKARSKTSAPDAKGVAGQIIEAGRKRRGEI